MPGFVSQPGGPPVAELATPEDYTIVQRHLSPERFVVIQANAYQFDNGSVLAVTRDRYPDNAVLLNWATSEHRRLILVDNPVGFYGL
jgi:D-galactarolactone isomerase